MSSLIKKLVIALIITVALGAVYYFTIGTSNDSPAGDSFAVSGSEVSLQTQKILSDTQTIDNYKLDISIFEDKRFKSLTEFGVTIRDVATGRGNPFAPVE